MRISACATLLAVLALGALLTACGSSDSEGDSGSGTASGTASGGSASGAAGSGASAGAAMGGSAGAATGGSAGEAGSAASAGAGPSLPCDLAADMHAENAQLALLAEGEALDLGEFPCTVPEGDGYACTQVTDYSS